MGSALGDEGAPKRCCWSGFPFGIQQVRLAATTLISTADVATDIAFWALLDPRKDVLLFALATAFIFVPIIVVLTLELIVLGNRCGCFDESGSVVPSDRGSWVWPAIRAIFSPVYPLIYLFSEKPMDATEVVDGVPRQAWASQLIELLLEALPQLLVQSRLALLEGRLTNPLYLTSVAAALLSLSDKVFRLRPRGWRASCSLQASAGILVCCLCVGGVVPAIMIAVLQEYTPIEIVLLHLAVAAFAAGLGLSGWARRVSKIGSEQLLSLCWPSWFLVEEARQVRILGKANQRKHKRAQRSAAINGSPGHNSPVRQTVVGRKVAVSRSGTSSSLSPAPSPQHTPISTPDSISMDLDPVQAMIKQMQQLQPLHATGSDISSMDLSASSTCAGGTGASLPGVSTVRPARRVYGHVLSVPVTVPSSTTGGMDGSGRGHSRGGVGGGEVKEQGQARSSTGLRIGAQQGRCEGSREAVGDGDEEGGDRGDQKAESDECECCECCEDLFGALHCSAACCTVSTTRSCICLASVLVACISPALIYLPALVESSTCGSGRRAEKALLMGHNSYHAWKKSLAAIVGAGAGIMALQGTASVLVLAGSGTLISIDGGGIGVGTTGVQLAARASDGSLSMSSGCFEAGACDEQASVFLRALLLGHALVCGIGLLASGVACGSMRGSLCRAICRLDTS